jgi:hypothetical protein
MNYEIIWKQIPNFSNFKASNLGIIKNIKFDRTLNNKPNKTGYTYKSLINDQGKTISISVHRLVCLAFHGEAPNKKMSVDHIDRNSSNNKPENLRWATHSIQMNNKHKPKERAGYPIWQLDLETKERIKKFENTARAADEVGGSRSNIGISARKGWKSNGFYWEYEKIEEIEGEEWVKMIKHNKEFFVSNNGRVKNIDSHNRLEVLTEDNVGYKIYICKTKGIFVHRLVAEAFLENPNNLPIVNHIDCNKSNNDVSNLEWSTISKNLKHAWENGCFDNSESPKKVYEIEIKTGKIVKEYKSVTELNNLLKITYMSDRILNKRIIKGHAWSYEPVFVPKEIKPKTPRINPGRKKIYKYDKDGNLIKKYDSISEASREENIPQTSLKVLYINKIRDNFKFSYDPPEEINIKNC